MSNGITRTKPDVEAPLYMFAGGFAFGIGTAFVLLSIAGAALFEGHVTLTGLAGFGASTGLLLTAVFLFAVGAALFLVSYRRNREALWGVVDEVLT